MPAALAPARSESLVSHHLNALEENKVDLDSLTNAFQTVLLQTAQTVLSVRDLEAVARACKRMHELIGHLVGHLASCIYTAAAQRVSHNPTN